MNCLDFDAVRTKPVKTYDPNPWGLYDMHGNVWEWTSDYYGDYPTGTAIDPKGADRASSPVSRGGSWRGVASVCRSANRDRDSANFRYDGLGFRFILTCDEPSSQAEEPTNANLNVETDASSWSESSTRKAGTRQVLKIGNAEYGFVWIPAGEFDMGSPDWEANRYGDERLHHVKLTKGFWMLETETTQALYKEVLKTNPSNFTGDNLPVEYVSWDDATKFCAELTKRLPSGLKASLPTEAQWEYACRAGTKTAYCYGNAADSSKMNYNSSGTKLVKNYDPNLWGLYDMHGNVLEWTSDYYARDYPTGTAIDPKGPNSASLRGRRGGGWRHSAGYCRSADRHRDSVGGRLADVGFRFLLSCD
jgi:formylglycine-generating enzyme required for sulfatase activity